MDYLKIIALDLGKFKTVACVMDTAARTHAFETIDMSPANVHGLVVRHVTSPPADTLVVSETCDTAGWVHDVCTSIGTSIKADVCQQAVTLHADVAADVLRHHAQRYRR